MQLYTFLIFPFRLCNIFNSNSLKTQRELKFKKYFEHFHFSKFWQISRNTINDRNTIEEQLLIYIFSNPFRHLQVAAIWSEKREVCVSFLPQVRDVRAGNTWFASFESRAEARRREWRAPCGPESGCEFLSKSRWAIS